MLSIRDMCWNGILASYYLLSVYYFFYYVVWLDFCESEWGFGECWWFGMCRVEPQWEKDNFEMFKTVVLDHLIFQNVLQSRCYREAIMLPLQSLCRHCGIFKSDPLKISKTLIWSCMVVYDVKPMTNLCVIILNHVYRTRNMLDHSTSWWNCFEIVQTSFAIIPWSYMQHVFMKWMLWSWPFCYNSPWFIHHDQSLSIVLIMLWCDKEKHDNSNKN